MEYESLGRPIVTTEDAIRANSYLDKPEPSVVKVGDAKGETINQIQQHWIIVNCTRAIMCVYMECHTFFVHA